MNKLAYDLALLCAEYSLSRLEPENCQESAQLVLETFQDSYRIIMESGEPLLDSFGKIG